MSQEPNNLPQKTTEEGELRLVETRLLSSSFNFISPLKVGPIDLEGSSLETTCKVAKGTQEIRVFLTYSATAREKGIDLFKLNAAYYGFFQATKGTPSEQLQAFAKGNAPAIVFPLLRATIATLTLASGFPPLTLPVVNFTKQQIKVEVSD